jgi:hypothetical protein
MSISKKSAMVESVQIHIKAKGEDLKALIMSSTQRSSVTGSSDNGSFLMPASPIDYNDFSNGTPDFESQHKQVAWQEECKCRRNWGLIEEDQWNKSWLDLTYHTELN